MKPWKGACADVVQAVIDSGLKVFLSPEFVFNETDSVTNPEIMTKRLEIMSELAKLYPGAFGWYFGSEAYIAPYFPDSFLSYVKQLATHAKAITPGKTTFTSPYGTRHAVNDEKFRAQLRDLQIDIVAYQDEVGCVRDPLPVETSARAFATLRAAHDEAGAGTPKLWANVESFTWQGYPNNVTSPLIPPNFQRIQAQIHAVSEARVDRVITFSAQALYDAPQTPLPWGPPNNSAKRAWTSYKHQSPLDLAALGGRVQHYAVGAPVTLSCSPDPDYAKGKLTDGLTGKQDPYGVHWLGCSRGEFSVDLTHIAHPNVTRLAVRMLSVSQDFYVDGRIPAHRRNVTVALPDHVTFFVDDREVGKSVRHPWPQESYDIFPHIFQVEGKWEHAKKLHVEFAVPKGSLVFVDEVIVE
jgi:Domain of unknown function (DUF4434)